FNGEVDFSLATFTELTFFSEATFTKRVDFSDAKFTEGADFTYATFTQEVDFTVATFTKGASFSGATFTEAADFTGATFLGRVSFVPEYEGGCQAAPIFSRGAVDFTEVIIEPPEALIIRNVDLQQWQFLDTDLRKAELTGVLWPTIGRRRCVVYDEKVERK